MDRYKEFQEQAIVEMVDLAHQDRAFYYTILALAEAIRHLKEQGD